MNEQRLAKLLRNVPVPGAEEAERRGLRVATAAFEERQSTPRPVLPRLALALVAATLLAALMLTPAGADVRDWLGDVFAVGVEDAEPALTDVPGGGRLLVQSGQGPWVVQADGSRRLLGEYGQATWSPRGLFVGATSERTLSAIEPDGTVHWSLSAGAPVADPRWSPSGFRIAYRSGDALRVVAGDGTGDAPLARAVAPVPAAWAPLSLHLLAYVDAGGAIRVADADSGEVLGSAGAASGTTAIEWAPDGSSLLETTPRSLRLHPVGIGKLAGSVGLGPARRVPLPPGATVREAAFSPTPGTIAVLLERQGSASRPARGELALVEPGSPPRALFTAPGRLSGLAFAPDGSRVLVGWPDADQWLFIPADGRGRVRAIGGISGEFSPGEPPGAPFPRIDGWCCPRR